MTPKIRQSVYLLGTVLSSLIGVIMLWGGIDSGAAEHINEIITGLVALLGAGAPAIAASTVNKQRKDGTLDSVTPADAVISGVQAVIDAKTQAEAEIDRVKNAVSDITGASGVGSLVEQVIKSAKAP